MANPAGIYHVSRTVRFILIALLSLLITSTSAPAVVQTTSPTNAANAPMQAVAPTTQATPTPLRIGVYLQAPFAQRSSAGTYYGYSVDLWRGVALRMGQLCKFQEFAQFDQMLAAVTKGEIDVAVADIFVTSERARVMDFSHPIADGGLRIMLNRDANGSLAALWRGLIDDGHIETLGICALALIVVSIPLLFLWRKIDSEFPAKNHDAFAEALLRSVTLTFSGKTWLTAKAVWYSKILGAIWMMCGVGIVAYVTSSFTSVMTLSKMRHSITGVDSLHDKVIGVTRGTVADEYCASRGFDTRRFDGLDGAAAALVAHEVDAVIDDGPIIQAFDLAHPNLRVTEIGPLFELRKYAFAFPPHSSHLHQVNVSLIELQETGDAAKLYKQYFGD
jgi:ABC-type amino acid transport substrate-binding protein